MRSTPRFARLSGAAVVLCLAVRAGALGCPGDCDGNGAITAGDLAAGIRALFDPTAGCLAVFDRDADERVSAAELLGAVRSAGDLCPMVSRACDTQRTALPIPDGAPAGGATSTIVVADTRALGAVAVDLDITHTWIGDLLVTLEHAATGRRVTLIDRPGFPASPVGCSHADVRCTLEDTAMTAAEDTCRNQRPALRGSLRPSAALAAFAGEPAAGTWTLRVADAVEGDTGALRHCCLALQAAPTATPTGTPSLTPTITATASATSTASLTATASASATAAPTDAPPASPSPSPTASEAPTDTPSSGPTTTSSPTPTPSPNMTASPTGAPAATEMTTPSPRPSPTASELPTDTPSATPSATPTDSRSPAGASRRGGRLLRLQALCGNSQDRTAPL